MVQDSWRLCIFWEKSLSQELGQAQKSEENTTAKPIPDGLVATEKDLREQFQGEGIKIEKAIFEKKEEKLHVFYTVTFDTLPKFT